MLVFLCLNWFYSMGIFDIMELGSDIMKVIDICDDYGGLGCLKKHYVDKGITDYNIYALGLNLSMGDLKGNREKLFKEWYEDEDFKYYEFLDDVKEKIDEDTLIRIWSSKKNDNDYLMLLYTCNYLRDVTSNISVIFCNEYNEYVRSIAALDAKEIDRLLKYEHKLDKEEIDDYANMWNELVRANSELRILEDGVIKNKEYKDYYDIILSILEEKETSTIVNLVGECMAREIINDAGLILYGFLIDKLIKINKIMIIKKGERHFLDTIEVGI